MKILVTVLCIQALLPMPLLQGVMRLPVLAAHYFYHNHTGGHIHFTEFIAAHYGGEEHQDKDHEHTNLPFHNYDFAVLQILFHVASCGLYQGSLPDYNLSISQAGIIARQHFHFSAALSSIWRPPKFA